MKSFLIIFIFTASFAFGQEQEDADSSATQDNSVSDTIKIDFTKVLKKYAPEIKKIFKKKIGQVTKEALQNDDAMKLIFNIGYDFLPSPIRWLIRREDAISYLMKNRYLFIDEKPPEKPIPGKE